MLSVKCNYIFSQNQLFICDLLCPAILEVVFPELIKAGIDRLTHRQSNIRTPAKQCVQVNRDRNTDGRTDANTHGQIESIEILIDTKTDGGHTDARTDRRTNTLTNNG